MSEQAVNTNESNVNDTAVTVVNTDYQVPEGEFAFSGMEQRSFGYKETQSDGTKKVKNIGPFQYAVPRIEELRNLPEDWFIRTEDGSLVNSALDAAERGLQDMIHRIVRAANQEAINAGNNTMFSLQGLPADWQSWKTYADERRVSGMGEIRKVFVESFGDFCQAMAKARNLNYATSLKPVVDMVKARDSLSFTSDERKDKIRQLLTLHFSKLTERNKEKAASVELAHNEVMSALDSTFEIADFDF